MIYIYIHTTVMYRAFYWSHGVYDSRAVILKKKARRTAHVQSLFFRPHTRANFRTFRRISRLRFPWFS